MANCLRVSRVPGIAARSASLPGACRSACAFRPAFRRNLSGGPKGPAIFDRFALPASVPSLGKARLLRDAGLASRVRLRSHRPGAKRWFGLDAEASIPHRCSVFPSEGSGPHFHCPSASFEPGRSPVRRLASGPLSCCPCDVPRRVSCLFSRVPKTAFGRLAHLPKGSHRFQKFVLLFRGLHPDPQPLSFSATTESCARSPSRARLILVTYPQGTS